MAIRQVVGTVVLAIVLRGSFASAQGYDWNLQSCLSGFSCDEGPLTPEQRSAAQYARLLQNYKSCLYGMTCDISVLTADQKQAVFQALLRRNYHTCLYGLDCDESLLSETEREAVAYATLERNYRSCLYGLDCRQDWLNAAQKDAVHLATIENNYRSCLYGLSCDETLLSENQRATLQHEHEATTSYRLPSASVPSAVEPAAGCEENDSCYGEISTATGRAKTVDVHGYYRKNGTYVQGHYRSAPRR